MPFIARFGTQDVLVPAGQSIMIGSFGAGQTKVYTASGIASQATVFALASVISGGFLLLPFAVATTVRVDASSASDVEFVVAVQPALTSGIPTVANALTARAGGGQALATPLTGAINRVTVCATAADSVLLPPSFVGARISVSNFGAAALNVFPATGEQINALGVNTALSVAVAGKVTLFECPAVGQWQALVGA
jgi:hypothetical protein